MTTMNEFRCLVLGVLAAASIGCTSESPAGVLSPAAQVAQTQASIASRKSDAIEYLISRAPSGSRTALRALLLDSLNAHSLEFRGDPEIEAAGRVLATRAPTPSPQTVDQARRTWYRPFVLVTGTGIPTTTVRSGGSDTEVPDSVLLRTGGETAEHLHVAVLALGKLRREAGQGRRLEATVHSSARGSLPASWRAFLLQSLADAKQSRGNANGPAVMIQIHRF